MGFQILLKFSYLNILIYRSYSLAGQTRRTNLHICAGAGLVYHLP